MSAIAGAIHAQDSVGDIVDVTGNYIASASLQETSADTSLVFNGTHSWSLDAHGHSPADTCAFSGSAVISNVTFVKTGGAWSKPVSGTISFNSPFKTIIITFQNGVASGTVTGKIAGIANATFVVTL